jgi:hypothetical protein
LNDGSTRRQSDLRLPVIRAPAAPPGGHRQLEGAEAEAEVGIGMLGTIRRSGCLPPPLLARPGLRTAGPWLALAFVILGAFGL